MDKEIRNKSLNRKQLLINMTDEFHKEIKIRAAHRNISMTRWVLQAIRDRIKKEQQFD